MPALTSQETVQSNPGYVNNYTPSKPPDPSKVEFAPLEVYDHNSVIQVKELATAKVQLRPFIVGAFFVIK